MGDKPKVRCLVGWHKCVLAAYALVTLLFGALVVWRSAFMENRHTDFSVYARAGWAARTGRDLYRVTNEHGLHYCYPPTFAVVMAPFAEPPATEDRSQFLSFRVSVFIWYVLSVGFAFLASHVLAIAIDPARPRWSLAWWEIRIWPVLFTLPGLGNTLSHGQVNSLVLLLIALFIVALIRGRLTRAGVFLAGATAIKVIPVFLCLGPLLTRERRVVLGVAGGLVICLFGIPALLLGSRGAWDANQAFVEAMIRPALGGAAGADRAKEMFNVLHTDNQSIQAVLHSWYWRGEAAAPTEPSGSARAIHWTCGLTLTVATLWSVRRQKLAGNDWLLFIGAMIAVLLFISPMCHLHYYCWTHPLVMGLLHGKPPSLSWGRWTWLMVHVIGNAIPLLFESVRNLGFAPLATFPLWCLAVHELRNRPAKIEVTSLRAAA